MLTVEEAIHQRRTIRNFRKDPVPMEAIRAILEAARLSPSREHKQPWRFLVVTDAKEKAELRQICRGPHAFVEQAPVVFVCCADLAVYSYILRKRRHKELLKQYVLETISHLDVYPTYWTAYMARPELGSVFVAAVANTFVAISQMILTATALGLGVCWVGEVGDRGEMEAFLGLPPTTLVVALLLVGHPAKVPPPRPRVSLAELLLRPLPGIDNK